MFFLQNSYLFLMMDDGVEVQLTMILIKLMKFLLKLLKFIQMKYRRPVDNGNKYKTLQKRERQCYRAQAQSGSMLECGVIVRAGTLVIPPIYWIVDSG